MAITETSKERIKAPKRVAMIAIHLPGTVEATIPPKPTVLIVITTYHIDVH
jgi:hypothetical protein